ncbi:MAG: cbb3-type cytochrome c oxidase subunit I [Rhodomicrobium sp.]
MSAAQHLSPVNSAGCLILAFAGAALAWGAAGFALLAFEDLRAALNLPWLAILPLPAMLFAFEINVLLAAALFMAHPEGRPGLRWRSALWLAFLYVQGVNAAAGLGLSLALQTGAAWTASSLYGILWAPVPLLFLAALLPGYRRTLQPAGWFVLAALLCLALAQLVRGFENPLLADCLSNRLCADLRSGLQSWFPSADGTAFALALGSIGITYRFIPQDPRSRATVHRLAAAHFAAIAFLYIAVKLMQPVPFWALPVALYWLKLWAPLFALAIAVLWLLLVLILTSDKLQSDAAARFFLLGAILYAVTAWAAQPLQSRGVNSLSHYTDWTLYQAYIPGLVLAASCGAIYSIATQLRGGQGLYSTRLAMWHFWFCVLGIPLYNGAMWISGIAQGLLWRAADGAGYLDYRMVVAIEAAHSYSIIKAAGSVLLAAGWAMMAYNVCRTRAAVR